ncbi:hypothetical protein ACNEP6_25725, partial [Escherichia coli]
NGRQHHKMHDTGNYGLSGWGCKKYSLQKDLIFKGLQIHSDIWYRTNIFERKISCSWRATEKTNHTACLPD